MQDRIIKPATSNVSKSYNNNESRNILCYCTEVFAMFAG